MAGRRFALYFSWSRPREIGANLGVLENRYPTLFEFRRALWPIYEWASDPRSYRQDVAGFLDHVVLFDFLQFNQLITEATGNPVSVIQREGDQPPFRELDDDFLREVDTLIVVSLDHLRTEQRASPGEVEAIRHFLQRENSCLMLCPHHDVGVGDPKGREAEFLHHGDRLVPSQQRLGGFAQSLLEALGLPVENRYGLNPGRAADGSPAPLEVARDLDGLRVLEGVRSFNLHPHLPHLYVTPEAAGRVRVLARQPVNPSASRHPFTDAGNRLFNALVWAPPQGRQAGNVFVCDATLWSAAFGGVDSLRALWNNLARVA
jgi:hypothetical protein